MRHLHTAQRERDHQDHHEDHEGQDAPDHERTLRERAHESGWNLLANGWDEV